MTEKLTNTQTALLALRNDPTLFVTHVLGAEPYPWQVEFMEAIRDNNQVAVRSANGVGKTTCLAWLILWFLSTHNPVFVACTAPSEDQLKDALWKELRTWHRKMPDWIRNEIVITELGAHLKSFPAEVQAKARTTKSENPEALQGIHSENMVFIIDEASGVQEAVFEVSIGAMSTPGAKTIMTGNPTRLQGFFYNAFHRTRAFWNTRKVQATENPVGGEAYAKFVAANYGDEGNIYRVRVLGEFPLSDDDTLIPLHWLEAAVDRDVAKIETAPVYWGLDIARFGSDRSALAKRQGNHLLEKVKSWQGQELTVTEGMVINEYNDTLPHLRPKEIFVDSIGMGAGVVDHLKEAGLPVRGVNVSEVPSVIGKYNRRRDELWYKAREYFERRDCRIPDDEQLIAELSGPSYKIVDSNGKIRVESKSDMKKRVKRSPDLADAFILTLMNQNDNPMFDAPINVSTHWIL